MKAILITILCVMFFIIVSFNKEENNIIKFKQKKEAGN